MDSHRNHEEIGGATVSVGDSYIWAAIGYLDSPTDYRECLPYAKRQLGTANNSIVTLDDCAHASWATVLAVALIGALAYTILRIIVGLLN